MQRKKIYLVNNLIRQVLEKQKEDNFFVDEKFITREDLFNALTYQGNIDTIMYLKNHYNYSYEKAEETLENFLFIKEGVSKKVDRIYSIFKELLDYDLLTINKEYLRLFKDSILLIPSYLKDDVELLHLLDLYSLDYEFYDLNIDNHLSSIKEFNNVDEEIIYLLQEIRKLLSQGVKLNQIKVIASKDYYLHLYAENQFSPIKFSKDKYFSYLNHYDFKLFMENLNCDDIEQSALSVLPKIKNLSLFKNLLDQYILDKDSLPKDEIKPYFIYKAKKMHYDFIFDNSIMVTSLDNVNVDDYVFVLDFNQDNYPSAYKDDDLFSSYEKDALFRNNYLNLSKLSEEELKTNLSLIKHLYISYNKPQKEIIVSSLKDSLNLDVVSYSQDNKLHSNHLLSLEKKNNFIGKRLDEFNSFGFSSPYIVDIVNENDAVNCRIDVNYKTYSNQYTFVKTNYKLDKISYTSINEYFKCQFKYYLKYVLKIDEFEDNIYSTRGKVFHKELELLAKDLSFDYKNYFSSPYIASFNLDNKANIFLSRDQEIIFNDILDIQKNIFQETELNTLCPEISNLQYDIDGVKLNGRVDLIMKNDSKYVLIDYKTGSDTFNKDDIQYGFSMQLIIYYLLMSYNYPSLEPLGIFIENIYDKDYIKTIKNIFNGISFADLEAFSKTYASDKNIIKGENLSKDEFDQLVQLGKTKIEEMIEGVKNNSFPIQPKKTYSKEGSLNDRSCDRCSYRDICYRKDEDYIILPKIENNKNNNVED